MEAPLTRKIGRECEPHRHRRYSHPPGAHETSARGGRKYLFTDQIDQLIREIYLSHPGAKTRSGGVRVLAKKVGIPHWALKKGARELGLARTKELPWSEAELKILERYAWMRDERIRLKLKAAGYARTAMGIHLKLRRMKFKHDPSFFLPMASRERWEVTPTRCRAGSAVATVIKGELSGSGNVCLDGELEGSIELLDGNLIVGPDGRIRANLQARSILVQGRVDGNLYGIERVELKKSAAVVGDIYTPRIAIEDGAYLKGNVRSHEDIASPQTKKEG